MNQYQKQFIKTLSKVDEGRRDSEILIDWLQMAKLSLAIPFYRNERMNKNYMDLAKKYSKEGVKSMCKLLDITIDSLENNPQQDFMGEIYMEVVGSSDKSGQFFSPYHLAYAMVKITIDLSQIDRQGYIIVDEPACGSGVMGIALCNYLHENGYGTDSCFMQLTDLDANCAAMAYIQLSLLGMPALVKRGNSLTGEVWERLYTVPYFLSKFPELFAIKEAVGKLQMLTQEIPAKATTETPVETGKEKPQKQPNLKEQQGTQLSLF